ncbi:MAG TPA: sulfite exporter TauE/SafE family protein, partial [Solirubrobacteraceae bacterium]|nr:sulfite exporter TauE/SafE family protein [Solirubrobacteraceae bacterium]
LILVFRLRPHRVVGTDVFHAAVLLWVAGLAHWVSGNVDFSLMGNILIGSIPGVLIGSQLVMRVPAAGLRPVLGCVLLGSALGVLTKAGVDVPVGAIIGAPVAVGVLAWALARARRPSLEPPGTPTPERA